MLNLCHLTMIKHGKFQPRISGVIARFFQLVIYFKRIFTTRQDIDYWFNNNLSSNYYPHNNALQLD